MKTKTHLLLSAALIMLALISCQHEILDPIVNDQSVNTTLNPGLDSLQLAFVSASVEYHGMPAAGAPPAKAAAVVTLALHNSSMVWALDSLIVMRASIMRYPEYIGAMKFPFDIVCRLDGSDWNARLNPNQKDTLWCSYRFDPGMFHHGDSLVIRCQIIDRHGNSKLVESSPIMYEADA